MVNGWENLTGALDILDALVKQIPGLDGVSDSAKENMISRLLAAQAVLWLCEKRARQANDSGLEMARRCLEAACQARGALDTTASHGCAQRMLDRIDRLHERAFTLCLELDRCGVAA